MFINNSVKLNDMLVFSKADFLSIYNDITEKEYENAKEKILQYVNAGLNKNSKQKEKRHKDIEKTRKEANEYYAENKERINARRRELYKLKKENKEIN